jgi:hypothetical protein
MTPAGVPTSLPNDDGQSRRSSAALSHALSDHPAGASFTGEKQIQAVSKNANIAMA